MLVAEQQVPLRWHSVTAVTCWRTGWSSWRGPPRRWRRTRRFGAPISVDVIANILDGVVLGLQFGLLAAGLTLVYGLGGVLNSPTGNGGRVRHGGPVRHRRRSARPARHWHRAGSGCRARADP